MMGQIEPNNQLVKIKAEDLPEFVERFNSSLPTEDFLESCRKAGELIKIPR